MVTTLKDGLLVRMSIDLSVPWTAVSHSVSEESISPICMSVISRLFTSNLLQLMECTSSQVRCGSPSYYLGQSSALTSLQSLAFGLAGPLLLSPALFSRLPSLLSSLIILPGSLEPRQVEFHASQPLQRLVLHIPVLVSSIRTRCSTLWHPSPSLLACSASNTRPNIDVV